MPQYTPEYDKHATSILTDVIYEKSVNEVRQVLLDGDIPVNRVYRVSEAPCNLAYAPVNTEIFGVKSVKYNEILGLMIRMISCLCYIWL